MLFILSRGVRDSFRVLGQCLEDSGVHACLLKSLEDFCDFGEVPVRQKSWDSLAADTQDTRDRIYPFFGRGTLIHDICQHATNQGNNGKQVLLKVFD